MDYTAAAHSYSAKKRFTLYAFLVLIYAFAVVLWGAYVRATGSGAGCGNDWPLCRGQVLPRNPETQTSIEFTHRVTSAVFLLAVLAIVIWAFRLFPARHAVRRYAVLSLLFLLLEALLGAGLVLFDYVAYRAAWGRALYLSAHLVNTQVLLAALTLVAWNALVPQPQAAGRRRSNRTAAAIAVALLISMTGALAALGDTLLMGVNTGQASLTPVTESLVQLRLLHPFVALGGGAFLVLAALTRLPSETDSYALKARVAASLLVMLQCLLGLVNVYLKAPIWMQLVHLCFANLLWLSVVIWFVQSSEFVEEKPCN